MIRFKFLSGDVNWKSYGGKWISGKQNNGNWDYWLVMELINMWDATGDEKQAKYVVTISSVSPEAAGPENRQRAINCCGWGERLENIDQEMMVEMLHTYGVSATVWKREGNNADKLLKEARYESNAIVGLFGFYMDRTMNAIGNTGWDFIVGRIGFPGSYPEYPK